MADEATPEAYQIHVWIRRISPMIWRRLLMRTDSTLAHLHDVLQIAFGWSDFHLHRFRIHGRDYGVNRAGGLGFSRDARTVRLADFQFRTNERFLYEYDFGDGWQHVIRVERRLSVEPRRMYPVCVGGQRAAPPEDCGDPWAFLERRDAVPWQVREHLERIIESVDAGDREAIRDELEAVESVREWFTLDRFDRREVNRRLQLYAAGDERWREEP
jgi:Plasmid pRiA4b ORF-3-like protein